MECLNCNTVITQTPGKRTKLYCSSKCRIEYCRKKKAGTTPKRGRGRPKKITFPSELPNPLPKNFSGITLNESISEAEIIEMAQRASQGIPADSAYQSAILAVEVVDEFTPKQSDFKTLWDSGEVDKIQPPKSLQEATEMVDIATRPPVSFQDYLNAIKLETWAHSTLRNFLKTEKN